MTVGIIGLGLIGGSLAKAFKSHTDFTIYGYDINEGSVKAAIKQNVIDGFLTDAQLIRCELVIAALYPDAVIEYIKRNKNLFKDLTRVAALNEDMWTELFLENARYLSQEIDRMADELKKYSLAIKSGDADTLHKLLEEGTVLKKKTLQVNDD